MPNIDLDKYPKIKQSDPKRGCIPVNIENSLKYYEEDKHNEQSLLKFYDENKIPLGFKEVVPHLEKLLPDFEIIFKGKVDFEDSIENVINHIKSNVDKSIPVLVSFKQIVNIPIGITNRGILVKAFENAHIRTAVGYNDLELCFFDPGDCQIKKYNYNSNEFSNQIKGDYHTLIVKRKL